MKAVILAGGKGTRLMEETVSRPKPLVEVGGKPILWHILKTYSSHGINEFVICLGYKGYLIKEYFANYFLHMSDVTVNVAKNSLEVHQNQSEPWVVRLIETGENTQTGGRLKRVARYLSDETGDTDFCFTYGDGVGNIDVTASIAFHRGHGKLATVTATRPPARFGSMVMDGHQVKRFEEKPVGDGVWINGGYFVLNRQVVDYIAADETIWEREPIEKIANEGQLMAWHHNGFWHPMDTIRDRVYLEELWESGKAPWKIW